MQLVVMLYDGAIRFCAAAEDALEKGDRSAAREKIRRAQAIVEELVGSLNMEAGGEIAQRLFDLYEYINYRLIQASLRLDPAPLAEVGRLLRELRSAWDELPRRLSAGQAATP